MPNDQTQTQTPTPAITVDALLRIASAANAFRQAQVTRADAQRKRNVLEPLFRKGANTTEDPEARQVFQQALDVLCKKRMHDDIAVMDALTRLQAEITGLGDAELCDLNMIYRYEAGCVSTRDEARDDAIAEFAKPTFDRRAEVVSLSRLDYLTVAVTNAAAKLAAEEYASCATPSFDD